jgi:DNA-binding NarL/FixJ family response regulator
VVRILIVGNYQHIRGMIRALLETEQAWEVCGEAVDGQDAICQCAALEPTLVILDVHLPKLDGLAAAREIFLRFPRMLVLFLTIDGSAHYALAAVRSGAQGLLVKGNASESLVIAVSTLLRGETYFVARRESAPGLS